MSLIRNLFDSFSSAFDINSATLSGAVDIVVVHDTDGNFLSTPFYVRFGKLHVLKSREKTVHVFINNQLSNFCMKLGAEGQAFFVEEINLEEEMLPENDILISPILQPSITSPPLSNNNKIDELQLGQAAIPNINNNNKSTNNNTDIRQTVDSTILDSIQDNTFTDTQKLDNSISIISEDNQMNEDILEPEKSENTLFNKINNKNTETIPTPINISDDINTTTPVVSPHPHKLPLAPFVDPTTSLHLDTSKGTEKDSTDVKFSTDFSKNFTSEDKKINTTSQS